MNIHLSDGTAAGGADELGDAGPLVAPEAEHLVEALSRFAVADIGSDRWLTQHGWLERLNMQAHVNAAQMRDEFVMEALVLHEKLPVLVHDLIATELWRARVLPQLREEAHKRDGVRLYQCCYHEAVVANLLEAVLYHRQACEAVADALVDLADYCQRRLVWLLERARPPADVTATSSEELRAALVGGGSGAELQRQLDAIEMGAALSAISILRFLTDHADVLPAGVLGRLVDTHDVLMTLAPLLEKRPWRAKRGLDGREVRFEGGQWMPVAEADAHRMPKPEAQLWLAVLGLCTDPLVRRRYAFTDFRKATVVRLRKYLHEGVVDQIPPLVGLQRAIDELSLSETPAVEHKPAYVLEQLPEIRDALARAQDWEAIAEAQLEGCFNTSAEAKRAHAEQLAELYATPAVERLLAGPTGAAGAGAAGGAAGGGADVASAEHVLELTFWEASADDDAADDEATRPPRAVVHATCARAPSVQTPFTPDPAAGLLSSKVNRVQAALYARAPGDGKIGAEALARVGPVELALDARKQKQWCQLGHDPTALRVQLLVARTPDGRVRAGAVRVTAPERHVCRLEFVPERAAAEHTAVVIAEGCAAGAQSQFRPTGGTATVAVPPSCRVRAEVRAGERVWRAAETRLELDASKALQWAQLGGRGKSGLRVQLRIRSAVHGGAAALEVASVYVTAPEDAAGADAEQAADAARATAAPDTSTANAARPKVEVIG